MTLLYRHYSTGIKYSLYYCVSEHTKTFGVDSTALQRVDGPVVVFQSVHQLQDSADAADGAVDGGGAYELRRQVRVEGQLDLHSHIYPQTDRAADLGIYNPSLGRNILFFKMCSFVAGVFCLVLISIA